MVRGLVLSRVFVRNGDVRQVLDKSSCYWSSRECQPQNDHDSGETPKTDHQHEGDVRNHGTPLPVDDYTAGLRAGASCPTPRPVDLGKSGVGFSGKVEVAPAYQVCWIMFENLEAGATIDEIMEWFHLTREQIVAVLEFAARTLDPLPLPQSATPLAADAHPV